MIALLVVYFATGRSESIIMAAAICAAVAVVDLALRGGDIEALGVQIRLFYTLLLVLGLAPGMGWIHVIQLLGTSIRVSIGYCGMERMLRLMPWNRVEALTFRRAWQILTARPRGGFVRYGDDDDRRRAARPPCAIGPYRPTLDAETEPALLP